MSALFGNTKKNSPNGISDITSRSSAATCGTFEREVVVPSERVASAKARLKAKGIMIVGTSEPGGKTRKIWFIKGGLAGL